MYKQKPQWAWRSVIVTILSVLLLSGLGLYLLTTDTEAAYLSYVLLGSLVILMHLFPVLFSAGNPSDPQKPEYRISPVCQGNSTDGHFKGRTL